MIEALAKGELQLGDLISGRIPLDNMLDKGIRALATEDKHVKICEYHVLLGRCLMTLAQ